MEQKIIDKAKSKGYRLANWGEVYSGEATHAICKCGHITEITEDSHPCVWIRLVKENELNRLREATKRRGKCGKE